MGVALKLTYEFILFEFEFCLCLPTSKTLRTLEIPRVAWQSTLHFYSRWYSQMALKCLFLLTKHLHNVALEYKREGVNWIKKKKILNQVQHFKMHFSYVNVMLCYLNLKVRRQTFLTTAFPIYTSIWGIWH
jgi:hypothetical protein